MKSRTLRSVGLWLASTALLAAIAAAAPATKSPERGADGTSTFGDVVDVQLVNVEVWVTDGKGRPVTGLTAADFAVYEDGEAVAISHFAEIKDRERRAGTGTVAPLPEPDVPGEELSEPAPDAGDNHLILYFDEMHMGLQGRKRLVSDLRKFLATQSVPPERVLVLRQGDNLTLQAHFGSSAEEIDAAISELAVPPGRTTQATQEKDMALRRLQILWEMNRQKRYEPCGAYLPAALADIDSYAAHARVREQSTLTHLAEVSTFLAGVPGVKTLVYLSDALDLRIGADLVEFVDAICPLRDQGYTAPPSTLSTDLSGALNELTRHANTNRVTIYSLQSSGLRNDSFFNAAGSSIDRDTIRGLRAFSQQRRINDRDGLLTLAAETGGRAILNQGRFDDDFATITREMGTYYSLAYAPPHGGDGLRHGIEVKVKREGTNVRHRQGYRDKSAEERMAERLQSVLFLGVGENVLSARLGAGTVRAEGEDRVTLPLHVVVPAENLVFLPKADGERAKIRLKVATRDHDSGKLEFEERVFEAPRPSDTEHLDFVVELDLAKSIYTIAVGLRDESTRETSYMSTTVEIQDPGLMRLQGSL